MKVDVSNIVLNDPNFVCEGIQHVPANEIDGIAVPQFRQMCHAKSLPIRESPELFAWSLTSKEIIRRADRDRCGRTTFLILITDVDAAGHCVNDCSMA